VPFPAAGAPEIVGKLPGLGRGLNHLRGGHALARHHVVVDAELEVLRGRLADDEAVRLDRRLFRVRVPLDDDALVQGPQRGFLRRLLPENVVVDLLQPVVLLERLLDLEQELRGNALGVAEDPNRDVGIAEHLLDHTRVGDDRRFVVVAAPQIEAVIRLGFDLSRTLPKPGMQCVLAAEELREQEKAVVAAEKRQAVLVAGEGGNNPVVEVDRLREVEVRQFVENELRELYPFERRLLLQIAKAAERSWHDAPVTASGRGPA
jgi:hypothetical protein